jgi:hypothetical protein
MSTRIQHKRGTAEVWTQLNPVLARAEIGYERDTGRFKIGDGSSQWTALPYAATQPGHQHPITDIIGLDEVIDDRLNTTLVAGDNIELVYDDDENTLTISSNQAIVDGGLLIASLTPVSGSPMILLLNFNGADGSTTFTDSSVNGFTVTAEGDVQISTAESKFGGASLYLPDTGDVNRAAIAAASDLDLSTGDFTIEFWCRPAAQVAAYPSMLGTTAWLQNDSFSIRYSHDFNADRFSVHSYPMGDMYLSSDTVFEADVWYHIAVTRSGTTDRLFVNGVEVDSFTHTTAPNWPNLTADGDCYIGGSWDGPSGQYLGYIDDLRIVKAALYTANFTPPTAQLGEPPSATALLLNFNGTNGSTTFTDSSPNGLAVTANGDAQISTTQSKFGGASLLLNGDDEYLITEENPLFDVASEGDLTLEAWVYSTDLSVNRGVFGVHIDSFDGNTNVYIYADGTVGVGRIGINEIVTDPGVVAENTWYHIAVVREGEDTTIYINGVAQVTSSEGVWSSPETPTLRIGYQHPDNGNTWSGYIDDVRLTRAAVYVANFTPPAAQLGLFF